MKKFFIFILSAFLFACESNEEYLVVIHTEYGDMKAVLYEETPQHKENFIKLNID